MDEKLDWEVHVNQNASKLIRGLPSSHNYGIMLTWKTAINLLCHVPFTYIIVWNHSKTS